MSMEQRQNAETEPERFAGLSGPALREAMLAARRGWAPDPRNAPFGREAAEAPVGQEPRGPSGPGDWDRPPLRACLSDLEHAVAASPQLLSQLDDGVASVAEALAPHGRDPELPDPGPHAFGLASCVLGGGSGSTAEAMIWLRAAELWTAMALSLLAAGEAGAGAFLTLAGGALMKAAAALRGGTAEPGLWTAEAFAHAADVIGHCGQVPEPPSARDLAMRRYLAMARLGHAELISAQPPSLLLH